MSDATRPTFVAYDALQGRPNIVVDGAGTEGTLLTLSHWPKSGTPAALKADSSAEIVFEYLDRPDLHVAAEAVSNNHFDEDGLCGVYALLAPEAAVAKRDLLTGVAKAGDFGLYEDRQAARVAFTIAAFADPAFSPLAPDIFAKPYPQQCAALYEALLPRLPEMLEDADVFARYWSAEDLALSESEAALSDGGVGIEEDAAADLAVVRIGEDGPEACHPMAIHNATDCNRVLTVKGHRYDLRYRYESWVQYISRPIRPRADLSPLAARLSELEPEGARWSFDGVDQITPHLRLEGAAESAIEPDDFIARVRDFLADAPPAWDPYD